jgi:hypothetical protein
VLVRNSRYASGTCTDQLSTVTFQYSDGSAKFAAVTKNPEMKDTGEGPVDRRLKQ